MKINEFLKEFKTISPAYQNALSWLFENFDIIEEILKGSKIPNIENLKEETRKNKDYKLYVLLVLKQLLDEERTRQENCQDEG